ncbi:type IV pilus modification protein PilV [Thalassotalea euphylliae]|uniref:type IV pilus modification protein PilV n=1 Tax=Thalassotalea euphylliae TaxID=1655234 RepID=UPI00362DE1B8
MISNQKGMTFIEVLVALFIIVTGVLGAVAMQSTAKQGSFDAMQRSIASSLAQDIVERIRNNNADTAILDDYVGTFGANSLTAPNPSCSGETATCTPAQVASYDLYEWTELIRGAEAKSGTANVGGLVNAVGCVSLVDQTITVTISWEGRTETSDGGAGECGSSSNKRRQLSLTAYVF